MKTNTTPNKPGTDHPGAPSEFRGVPSKGEQHSHGHKLAAEPVTPTKTTKMEKRND